MLIQGLGDIWVLVQGATFVIQTLHDAATKAPKQVKELLGDASNLEGMLKRIESMINEQGGTLKSHDGIKRDLVKVLKRCGEMVEGLKQIATSYQSIMDQEGEASDADSSAKQWLRAMNSPQGLYRRIKWTTMEAAVRDLRGLLAQHMQALQVIMQFLATQQIAQLQVGVSRILHLMEQQPGRVDQKFQPESYTTPARSPISPPIDSGNQFSAAGTPFISPLIAAQSRNNSGSPTDASYRSNTSSPPITFQSDGAQTLEAFQLPNALIDPFKSIFPDNLPELAPNFPRASTKDFDYAGPVSESEHNGFINDITKGKEIFKIPVESVEFVFRKSPVAPRVVIEASDAGHVMLLKTRAESAATVTDIWTLNIARTVRIRQKLPVWDDIIPYSANGEPKSAVVEQGFGLSFVVFDNGRRETHSIPTTWVTYKFWQIADCEAFQEQLYGWGLQLTIPVKEIYSKRFLKPDEQVAALENIRIWRDRFGSQVQFMAPMIGSHKRYLQFNLGQGSLKSTAKGETKLHMEGFNVAADDESQTSERNDSVSSLSTNASFASHQSSVFRRSSQDKSSSLGKITIKCYNRKDRDDLLTIALNSRPKSSAEKPIPSRSSTRASPQIEPEDAQWAKSKELG